VAYITVDITVCLLCSFCVVFFFWAAVNAFALLSCSIILLLHILNCFIEQINGDDDDGGVDWLPVGQLNSGGSQCWN